MASLSSSGGQDGLLVPLIGPVVGLIILHRPLDFLSLICVENPRQDDTSRNEMALPKRYGRQSSGLDHSM